VEQALVSWTKMDSVTTKMKLSLQTYREKIETMGTGNGRCAESSAMLLEGKEEIGCCRNAMREEDDPTAHAAIVLTRLNRGKIRKAPHSYTLLLSKKPCALCMAGIYQARIRDLFYLQENEIKHIHLNLDNINNWYEEISTNIVTIHK
jgi:tRNA(Arg) A34 adenosine deaminase TadA